MRLTDIRDALLTLGVDVFHFHAKDATGNYIVWAEDGEAGATYADNKKQSQIIEGTLDYYTKDEYDPLVDKIQGKKDDNGEWLEPGLLNMLGVGWYLNSIQYEKDTAYIHYEWVWRLP